MTKLNNKIFWNFAGWKLDTVEFFSLSQPQRKVFKSKIESKHYKDLYALWLLKLLKTDNFVNFSLKSYSEEKLYRLKNLNFPVGLYVTRKSLIETYPRKPLCEAPGSVEVRPSESKQVNSFITFRNVDRFCPNFYWDLSGF